MHDMMISTLIREAMQARAGMSAASKSTREETWPTTAPDPPSAASPPSLPQYVYIFVVGSYRVWTLLRVPTAKNFPYSNRHSVKVMVLGWLGIMPMVIFTFRYAQVNLGP
jgi:hypothetical protein